MSFQLYRVSRDGLASLYDDDKKTSGDDDDKTLNDDDDDDDEKTSPTSVSLCSICERLTCTECKVRCRGCQQIICRWCAVRDDCCGRCTDALVWPTLALWRDTLQDPSTHLYAYAIPNKAALDTLSSFAPLIEIGCGTGYWASLLRARGVVIRAFDIAPTGRVRGGGGGGGMSQTQASSSNSMVNEYHGSVPAFTTVERGGAEQVKRHAGYTLFLCYPPPDDPLALECLRGYRGDYFVLVGEWRGNTGTREFEKMLMEEWNLYKTYVRAPTHTTHTQHTHNTHNTHNRQVREITHRKLPTRCGLS